MPQPLPVLTPAHDRVIVTGAGSGIGRAVTIALARSGTHVFALGRRLDALEQTAALAGPAVTPVACDVRDTYAVDTALRDIEFEGAPTGLVHAAAQMTKMLARDMTSKIFRDVVDSTLIGSFNILHRWAAPLLTAPVMGSAVMLTSNSASLGTPGVAHSSAGKAGVEALVKSLAREWGPSGITINAIGPGAFPVDKSAAAWSTPSVETRMRSAIALGRYGELDEIVGPIAFLLSRGATYVTGQLLRVDGGLSLTRWSVEPEEMSAGVNNNYG
ncbi:MAG TPA: SDR family oxidoreductase [Jatrophihabitantaceae bacterium]|jgi:NAD(P)-dependent dehydrogenase (short-subunit alcohol dehydrogenase family)